MRTKDPEKIKRLEAAIDEYTEAHGVSPSMRELGDMVGMDGGSVSRYLAYMRAEGILDYSGRRNITTGKARITRDSGTVRVPRLGRVSCGLPKLAEENIEEYVLLPVSVFGGGKLYALEAVGDSMINAGIREGDLVIIRQQDTARPGQIVVALVGDEATLKTFRPQANCIHLHPENDAYEDIVVRDCLIQGVAIKVLKNLE